MTVLGHQIRLGRTITILLAKIRPNGLTSFMPDHGPRMIRNAISMIKQPPANVDIVARRAMAFVESTHFFPSGTRHRQIAARNMFGFGVVNQHGRRSARGRRNGRLQKRPSRWRNIRSPGRAHAFILERQRQIRQPVASRLRIVIKINKDRAARLPCTKIPRFA